MSWLQTHSGRAFDLRQPRAADVSGDDIAHALAHICRYNGHTARHYSVAEHCCHIADALERDHPEDPYLPIAGLLHDAAEAYVGDLTYPLYQALSRAAAAEIRSLMATAQAAIHEALFVPDTIDVHDPRVRDADLRILLDERAALLRQPPPMAWNVEGMEPLGVQIRADSPEAARVAWLDRFDRYSAWVPGMGR